MRRRAPDAGPSPPNTMPSCLPSDRLIAFLAAALPAAEAAAARPPGAHSQQCRAQLAALTDDPDLRTWVSTSAMPATPVELAERQELLRRLAPRSPESARPPGNALAFLGPPAEPGDLGTFGPYRV